MTRETTHQSPSTHGWPWLMAVLLACLPLLLLGIDQRLTTHTMENLAIVTSQETFLRMAEGERGAWLVSTNDGRPRLEKPPMVAWLNLLAWRDLDPATTPPQQLIFRARCVSVVLSLAMIAAVYLLARMLGDGRFAVMAALVLASMFFFQRQARTASYDIHYVAWTTIAVALGAWAMNPLGGPSTLLRRLLGWGSCAVALAAAALSKNPLPYLLGVPPLIMMIVVLSSRRREDALWLLATVVISALPVAAWYWHVFETYPRIAERVLTREMTQPRESFQPVWYYIGLFGLVAPWTLWLMGGLIEPFRLRDRVMRRAALLALLWFAMIFIVMSIPAAKQQRYILGIVPAVALLVAIFIRSHDDRTRRHIRDRFFDVISFGHWVVLMLVSLAAGWFMIDEQGMRSMMSRSEAQFEPVVVPLPLLSAIMLSAALLAVCALGVRWHSVQPWRSSAVMAVWMMILMTVFWRQESMQIDRRVYGFVEEAARVRAIVGDAPLRSLRASGADRVWQFNEEFRIYYGRLIRRIEPDGLDAWLAQESGPWFLVARESESTTRLLRSRGFEPIDSVYIDRREHQTLWRRASVDSNR